MNKLNQIVDSVKFITLNLTQDINWRRSKELNIKASIKFGSKLSNVDVLKNWLKNISFDS